MIIETGLFEMVIVGVILIPGSMPETAMALSSQDIR